MIRFATLLVLASTSLAADGTETKNLARQRPEFVKNLAAQWPQWAARCGPKP